MAQVLEQYRLTLSGAGKIRNRAEAHLIEYTQSLLAGPVELTLEQVHKRLHEELAWFTSQCRNCGTCRLTEPTITTRIIGKPHLVTRGFGIYGRGRGIYTLSISETVRKDATNGYTPVPY